MIRRPFHTILFFLILCGAALTANAQQTGSISGNVTDTSGAALPGVTVEARSPVLPGPRVTVTAGDGTYQLPALPPGTYTVTYTLQGMQTVTRQVAVSLNQVTSADASLGVGGVAETVTVVATTTYADRTSAALTNGLTSAELDKLPTGTQYRDLVNDIPGVQYTQQTVRGPSAGASGQSNVYNFDGVNVTLPLFGTLSAEPASQDISEFTVVKGGATAIDFNRAGGFSINTISKSGTSQFHGEGSFRFQQVSMSAAQNNGSASLFDENRAFTDANVGGPIVKDKAYFYGSYYRPTVNRDNSATAYGPVPNLQDTRNEGFAKVTMTPTRNTLFNVSYRDSHELEKASGGFSAFEAGTAGSGAEAWQRIGNADGSWIIDNNNFATFKYTHFSNPTQGVPDNVSAAAVNTAIGTHLPIDNLASLGLLTVPKPIAGNAAQNAFVQPTINKFGYLVYGVPQGGGIVGFASLLTDQDNFGRNAGQFAYNTTFATGGARHSLHGGYQQYVDSEDLKRTSNGWGSISVPAGTIKSPIAGLPIFYQATYQAQGTGLVPTIHSEYHSRSFEVNDAITWHNWTINAGLIASHDTLFGQGLTADATAPSGFVKSTATTSDGRQYQEYEIPFSKMIQPRLSATWAYNGKDTMFVSYARYNPAASSLPRAASWDRNLEVSQNADFDANGNLFEVENVAASTGKLFVPDMTPQRFDEWVLGTAKQFNVAWSGRAYFQYRKGTHYWEDTPNMSRILYNEGFTTVPGTNAPIPQQPYIANLAADLATLGGSGNSYVIADLDGSFTDYRALTLEAEYRQGPAWIQGSYTYSRYYGNFDQDGSSTAESNDANIFIGSSNIGDGPGRQLWDNKLGRLRGDRPNALKIMGSYTFRWNGSFGAFAIAQSGEPWETHSYLPYAALTTSTSNTARYSEPAGSHRSDAVEQMDINYTQQI
ncbi:MAG TPA: carboxypeptidase regulatory-like domain-containing protein, partial [Vicinamibacterales bacterium]|nr:carboxypeptidase regulatory-like domain-containing protein [Vicinamibacterales bacterium]